MNITTIGRGDQSALLQEAPCVIRASDLPQLNPFALSESTGYKFPWDVRVGYRADAFKAPVMSSASGTHFRDFMHDPRFNRHAVPILDLEGNDDYTSFNIFEKQKRSIDNKQSSSFKKQADFFGTPNIDPDNFEPKDGEKEKVRKFNCEKQESPIWKELKSYRNEVKTNGLTGKNQPYYQWDHTHNDIEVYGPKGKEHLGSMDPVSGEMYKPGVSGRTIKDLIR